VSLRARLTLFFVAIVVLPVAVATAYGWQAVARSSQRRVQVELANDPALLQAMAAGCSAGPATSAPGSCPAWGGPRQELQRLAASTLDRPDPGPAACCCSPPTAPPWSAWPPHRTPSAARARRAGSG
jgi:hypothetical protein